MHTIPCGSMRWRAAHRVATETKLTSSDATCCRNHPLVSDHATERGGRVDALERAMAPAAMLDSLDRGGGGLEGGILAGGQLLAPRLAAPTAGAPGAARRRGGGG